MADRVDEAFVETAVPSRPIDALTASWKRPTGCLTFGAHEGDRRGRLPHHGPRGTDPHLLRGACLADGVPSRQPSSRWGRAALGAARPQSLFDQARTTSGWGGRGCGAVRYVAGVFESRIGLRGR